MNIQLVYSPYNFFTWSKKENLIPLDSLLICGTPTKSIEKDDSVCKFIINQNLDAGEQLTESIAGIGAYLCQKKQKNDFATETQLLLGRYVTEWTMQPDAHLKLPSTKNFFDLIHPIGLMLKILANSGYLGSDILAYMGEEKFAVGDFFFAGKNTQEQINSLINSIIDVFGEVKANKLLTELATKWELCQSRYSNTYGFYLQAYDFSIKKKLSV